MTQTVPDISPLMPMHQDPLLGFLYWRTSLSWTSSQGKNCYVYRNIFRCKVSYSTFKCLIAKCTICSDAACDRPSLEHLDLTHLPWTKSLSFQRRSFQMHLHQWKNVFWIEFHWSLFRRDQKSALVQVIPMLTQFTDASMRHSGRRVNQLTIAAKSACCLLVSNDGKVVSVFNSLEGQCANISYCYLSA